MDTVLVLALVAGIAILALVVMLALRGERSRAEDARHLVRLAELAERLHDTQNQLAGRLQQTQQGFNERLDALAKRVGDGLIQHGEKTGETLRDLYVRIAAIDSAQKTMSDLAKQVVGLQDILANKQARGAFGEVQLENLVRDALPPGAFEFQATLANGKRVDCLIRLPKPPGAVAIDSKFPLEAYRTMHAATDEAARTQAARAFAADVGRHVDDIAKRYVIAGETADWALMFLPSEAIHAELHVNFPEVVEDARRRRVGIVSPNTLWATLTTVRAVLRDAQMMEQAGRIKVEVDKLLADVTRLDDRVDNLQRHFGQIGRDIEEIGVSSRKIVRGGERIREMRLDDEEKPRLGPVAPGPGS